MHARTGARQAVLWEEVGGPTGSSVLSHALQFSFTQGALHYGAFRCFHRYEWDCVLFSIVSTLLLLRIPEGEDEKYDSGMENPPETLTLQRSQTASKILQRLGSILFAVGSWG